MTIDYAERARAFIGSRFRPQGRDAHGLDCIGLVLAAFDISAAGIPRDYALRGDRKRDLEAALERYFRRVRPKQLRPGDVMVLAAAADQLHLAVRTDIGFVHAHAGLRRVVETPGMPDWLLLGVYRKRRKR